jgi:putative ATPase
MPDELKDHRIYQPQKNPQESKVDERMKFLWKDKFK